MSPLERAQQYVDLFNHYEATGANWRHNVPVDATVGGQTVWLQGVRLSRKQGRWSITSPTAPAPSDAEATR